MLDFGSGKTFIKYLKVYAFDLHHILINYSFLVGIVQKLLVVNTSSNSAIEIKKRGTISIVIVVVEFLQ